ncbi:MAG: hypothetical protein AAGI63_00270 [Planctomycetota bacterium]
MAAPALERSQLAMPSMDSETVGLVLDRAVGLAVGSEPEAQRAGSDLVPGTEASIGIQAMHRI